MNDIAFRDLTNDLEKLLGEHWTRYDSPYSQYHTTFTTCNGEIRINVSTIQDGKFIRFDVCAYPKWSEIAKRYNYEINAPFGDDWGPGTWWKFKYINAKRLYEIAIGWFDSYGLIPFINDFAGQNPSRSEKSEMRVITARVER